MGSEMCIRDRLAAFVAEKGSIALNGVSLTVNLVSENMFCVNIIEHTWKNTNLGDSALGSYLNLEIDMLARYVSRLMQVAGEIR